MDKFWTQVTPSDYSWEREALQFLRDALPDHEPYRVWANFEFIAHDASMNEVDALVVTPKGIFLLEIKSHPGEISGDAGQWVWTHEGRRRSMDNPRKLAERKAKKLASLLRAQRAAEKSKYSVPFINVLVFLSAENVVNRLQGPARQNVCTRKDIIQALKKIDEDWIHRRIDRPMSKTVSRAMEEAGIKESQRSRRVGPYELVELMDESDDFQDWLAEHTEVGSKRRIRVYLTRGKPSDEAENLQKAARREFRILEGIEHTGILRALDLQHHDQGPALVYDHDPTAKRLDLFLAELEGDRRLDVFVAFDLLRQISEAVAYAHGRKLCHRALSPQSIWVRPGDGGKFRIKISNWATADRHSDRTEPSVTALSHLSVMVREDAGPYMALEAHSVQDADAVYLDVFSLGAIAYLLLTGKPPANNDLELQDKLSRGKGLQITDEINGAGADLVDLIQYATHPDITQRYGSVDEFLEYLEAAEDEITRPENQRREKPTEAQPGDYLDEGIRIVKRLGSGASAVAFVVDYQGQQRVLKLANDPEHNARIRMEGETIAKLRHQSIIAHHATREFLGHAGLILDYADEGSLARRIREQGAVQFELLERFGNDLLGAITHLEEKGISHRDIKPENIGLLKGKKLHLVLFDFSLSGVSPDNISAGTIAYTDPFIRDAGRRRWDNYAERFSAALTLYEMTTGGLPRWANGEGMPPLIDGRLEIDASIFDPGIREFMSDFFAKALARDVKDRFDNAEEMHRAWQAVFARAREGARAPEAKSPSTEYSVDDAQPDTQIGLLPLSAAALDTLSRLNIHTVAELLRLPRNELVRMTGVGIKTRRELSELIERLQRRLEVTIEPEPEEKDADGLVRSVDALFATILPRPNRATDPDRVTFLEEFLGCPSDGPPGNLHDVYWPNLVTVCTRTGIDRDKARDLQARIVAQWSKNKNVTQLRLDIVGILADNGGLMTAAELAEIVLLHKGSSEPSPTRERRARAVIRAAVETELARQESRITLRRSGKRVLIADNADGRGEELADYAEALGQLADEMAESDPLISPSTAIDRIRAVVAPDSFAITGNHRILRLAVAASQGAALSSRAEFYPRGMAPERAIELAQGALLGSRSLSVDEVRSRIEGRYPEAHPLPGRPQLDELVHGLGLGFKWDGNFVNRSGKKGAYCLPQAGESSYSSRAQGTYFETRIDAGDPVAAREIERMREAVTSSIASARFLALSARLRLFIRAREKLLAEFDLFPVSFDELLLRHLHALCDGMAHPPRWEVVIGADRSPRDGRDWSNLQNLVRRVLPDMAAEILGSEKPVLLTDPGLLARYGLINTWLGDLRRDMTSGDDARALILLIANDLTTPATVIDGVTVPTGAGSREFTHIPSAWLVKPSEHPGSA